MSTALRILILAVSGFVAGAWASERVPESRHPVEPVQTVSPAELPAQFSVEGRGRHAANALAMASSRLPFDPGLPATLPSGYEVAHCRFTAFADGNAFIDLLYLADGEGQIQVFQSNYAPDKPILAPIAQERSVTIDGTDWEYRLLAFPQPNGSELQVHSLSTWSEGRYLSLALHSTGDRAAEWDLLTEIAASVR